LPQGLFDKIIKAINLEEKKQRAKKILRLLFILLILSLITLPISAVILLKMIIGSGLAYFFYSAITDLEFFTQYWQLFFLAILESIPITNLIVFIASLILATFTLRLFLYRKKFLLTYLFNH